MRPRASRSLGRGLGRGRGRQPSSQPAERRGRPHLPSFLVHANPGVLRALPGSGFGLARADPVQTQLPPSAPFLSGLRFCMNFPVEGGWALCQPLPSKTRPWARALQVGVWGVVALVPWNSFCLPRPQPAWVRRTPARNGRLGPVSGPVLGALLGERSKGWGDCQGLSSLGFPHRMAVTQSWTATGQGP